MRHIESYIHHNRIGVLLGLYTPDDMAVRTREFKSLALDLAMQIAASNPVATVALSDDDRNHYDSLKLTIARHPSEILVRNDRLKVRGP